MVAAIKSQIMNNCEISSIVINGYRKHRNTKVHNKEVERCCSVVLEYQHRKLRNLQAVPVRAMPNVHWIANCRSEELSASLESVRPSVSRALYQEVARKQSLLPTLRP